MSDKDSIFLWLLLLAIFAGCVFWQMHENKRIRQSNNPTANWLSKFAWQRSFQFLAALACSFLLIGMYDWQLSKARSALPKFPLPLAAPIAAAPKTDMALPAEPPAPQSVSTIESLYNPEKTSSDNQSRMDAIKKRYEDILVTYLFLRQCGLADSGDYRIIMTALGTEIASVNAPGRLQYDILTSARGSFSEMYRKSPCQGANMESLVSQYRNYIKALNENFPSW